MLVKTSKLVPKAVLLEDIVAKSGRTIIPENTILTKKHIKILQYFLIDEVNVSTELADGKRFIPKERETLLTPTSPSTSIEGELFQESFHEHYQRVVEKYQEMFKQWQSGFPIDIATVREIFLPLLDRLDEVEDELYLLNQLSIEENYIYHHAVSVGLLAAQVAKAMEYDKGEQIQVGLAGLLSDSGMSKINPTIFSAKRALMYQERRDVEQHPTYSYRLIEEIPTLTKEAKLGILQHHERNDRSGYPLGIGRDKIHPYAQIIAICDVYHAMTCERFYQKKSSPFVVLEEILNFKYTKFDEGIVSNFVRGIFPLQVHSTVQLTNGKVGQIVFLDPEKPTRPIVKLANEDFFILEQYPEIYIEKIL